MKEKNRLVVKCYKRYLPTAFCMKEHKILPIETPFKQPFTFSLQYNCTCAI